LPEIGELEEIVSTETTELEETPVKPAAHPGETSVYRVAVKETDPHETSISHGTSEKVQRLTLQRFETDHLAAANIGFATDKKRTLSFQAAVGYFTNKFSQKDMVVLDPFDVEKVCSSVFSLHSERLSTTCRIWPFLVVLKLVISERSA
jgi:hypothetical protein